MQALSSIVDSAFLCGTGISLNRNKLSTPLSIYRQEEPPLQFKVHLRLSSALGSQMEDGEVSIGRSKDHMKIEMQLFSEANNAISMTPELKCSSVCVFSEEASTTLESMKRWKSVTKLSGLIVFYLMVMLVEIIGGVKANSLAVMTDAAHLLTDVAGFSISLFTVWASAWKATSYQSFGFDRLEVLGALLSVQLIWLISALLIYEAVDRILQKSDKIIINIDTMTTAMREENPVS
ncbi:hypothetical protein V6N12_010447 [Hibiscus sabdariffa]|uniref:Cation efflux protein transmembrane domain-containing protein n=1 Tax=Hibiscus sabdariffa TaxID=183260 RepID=A0ABR2EK44_9ROSI